MINRGFEYKMGLNQVENFNPICDCTPNALYFSDLEHIHEFIIFGNVLFEVSCPDDAKIVQVENNKYKTDKLVLERRVDRFEDVPLLQDIYKKAVQNDENKLRHVPDQYITYEICLEAVKRDGNALRFVPDGYLSDELVLEAVIANAYSLQYVPEEMREYDLCLRAVKTCGYMLRYVPEDHLTYDMCLAAIESDKDTALVYVPIEFHKYFSNDE